jgi:ubiquinone/menaquinone biosynthesis C-methylase UbiE
MTPLVAETLRWAYRGQQEAFFGGSALVQRMARRFALGGAPPITAAQVIALRQSFVDLLRRDYENAAAGIYPASLLFQIPLSTYARMLPRLAADLPKVLRRKQRDDWKDLPAEVDLHEYPPYYRRTFHWQSDGYLSRRSAELYDLGVEFLFGGTADVMRRQVIPPIVAHARGRARPPKVLEVACGTGRVGAQLMRALPHASYTGIDLSPWYIDVARERLGGTPGVELVTANAEALPLPDESFDAVFSVYLFHELPRNARRKVWSEMRRVLRPGGCLVVEDSLQPQDAGELAIFLERFPQDMHEPFYRDYLRDDLAEGLEQAGFQVHGTERAFLSKVVSAHRPPSRPPSA